MAYRRRHGEEKQKSIKLGGGGIEIGESCHRGGSVQAAKNYRAGAS